MATLKQQKAIEKLVENGGNVSKAMRDAGYSRETAKSPSKLTSSKAFIEALEKKLPNSHLLKKHREFLDAPRQVRRYVKGQLTDEYEEIDPISVKALDMAYKLKGFYDDTPENTRPITVNIIKFDANTNTGNNDTTPLPTKTISITIPASNGQGDKASGNSVAQA